MTEKYYPVENELIIEPWRSESGLFLLVLFISIITWIFLAFSIIGIIYVLIIGGIFFISHISFIAYIKGSAVKIGNQQFPELNDRIKELSTKLGIHNIPDAYIMQAGGSLNALATKLFRSNYIVLPADAPRAL